MVKYTIPYLVMKLIVLMVKTLLESVVFDVDRTLNFTVEHVTSLE
jgi:hypothetical protein